MTSYRIWVPSKQRYIRMFEINCEQYRNILKVLEEDAEFDFILNDILVKNIQNEKFKISDFTIIDKFVIFLQLKIRSCGSDLKLVRVCEKCNEKTNITINLNNVISRLAPSIDKSFVKTFIYQNTEIVCDIPSITQNDLFDFDVTDINNRINFYLYSFIKNIKISNTVVNLENISENDKIKICEQLPFTIINEIKNEFVNRLSKILTDQIFFDSVCGNRICGNKFSINLDIQNMNDIIQILFRDESASNILMKYANLTMNANLDFNFYKNISPAELNILNKVIEDANKTEDTPSNKEIDMFDQYRNQTKHMQETTSEFF